MFSINTLAIIFTTINSNFVLKMLTTYGKNYVAYIPMSLALIGVGLAGNLIVGMFAERRLENQLMQLNSDIMQDNPDEAHILQVFQELPNNADISDYPAIRELARIVQNRRAGYPEEGNNESNISENNDTSHEDSAVLLESNNTSSLAISGNHSQYTNEVHSIPQATDNTNASEIQSPQ